MKSALTERRPVLFWTLAGALVGLMFPVSAATFELALGLTPPDFAALFLGSPTDIVVLLSPVLLALAGNVVGWGRLQVARRMAELNADRERLYAEVQAHYEVIGAVEKTQRAILDHLDSGICTVDAALHIHQGHNSAFRRLFGPSDLAGQNISDTVFATWTEKQKAELREAVSLAFSNTASSDEMLNDILPAREFMHVGGPGAEVRYVRVSMTRMFREQGVVDRVMFIFHDQTVERRLKEEEERHQRQIDDQYKRVRQLLRHDRSMVFGFLSSLSTGIDRAAESLRALTQGTANREAVMAAAGTIHSIKGEAFSLDFDTCAEKAKALETYLKSVSDKALGLEEHLQIIQLFEALSDERKVFERMIGRMAAIAGPARPPAGAALEGAALAGMEQPLSAACQRSAQELGKRARLSFSAPDDRIPVPVFESLKESLFHLVRNSVAHGIECSEERRARGKPETGTVSISLRRADGRLSVEYADDGKGFDTESIRAAVVARGLASPEVAQKLTSPDLIRYVFKDGFSTARSADMVSGQGMGMSVVRRRVTKDLHGSLQLIQKPGKGMGCRISIPDPVTEAGK